MDESPPTTLSLEGHAVCMRSLTAAVSLVNEGPPYNAGPDSVAIATDEGVAGRRETELS